MFGQSGLWRLTALFGLAIGIGLPVQTAHAWDHPGHMTTAAIAFAEIERERPDLIDKIGLLMLKHPDPAPFWVASGGGKGKERTRRMFICSSKPRGGQTTQSSQAMIGPPGIRHAGASSQMTPRRRLRL